MIQNIKLLWKYKKDAQINVTLQKKTHNFISVTLENFSDNDNDNKNAEKRIKTLKITDNNFIDLDILY